MSSLNFANEKVKKLYHEVRKEIDIDKQVMQNAVLAKANGKPVNKQNVLDVAKEQWA